ncbi:sigma-54-dependent transcriptional regulator [Desulfotalea psychrophila]|uniref:Probable two-component system response regulator (Ntr family) n=1 Tax=Desulfotalea psychrophila (strain LSv54 / DSM 12343) TaxID=177439 RepID=Q6ARB9_DESPS|nr:sigma-54 dependent transcriptional regulator [Desulfotalea psychrophila]CAG35105.1 probable two-component system response regulator (Ntr family) [Desulfotalea psychrophila LSv54]
MKKILLVDDDKGHRTMLKVNLGELGYQVITAGDGDEVLAKLTKNKIDLILLDMKMPRIDGLATLSLLSQQNNRIPVIVITAFSSMENAIEAMKKGAFDYVTKPVDIDNLHIAISKALHQKISPPLSPGTEPQADSKFPEIIGESAPMQELFSQISLIAPSDATILLSGESGTGKELVATAIHRHSKRKEGALIRINCAALHENLLESELFGHELGAFTGAAKQKKGLFERADKGTLFLDEIGDMSLTTQVKILRVLQEGEFERVGGNDSIKVNVRIIAASHRNLEKLIEEGTFRQDLFFRLSVVPLHLPALRERLVDIPILANFFLSLYNKKNRKDIKGFSQEALDLLMEYPWPGNIRELENSIERGVILCLGEQITAHELPPQFFRNRSPGELSSRDTLRDVEKRAIQQALARSGFNKSATAKQLGIARQTLLNKIRDYGLE